MTTQTPIKYLVAAFPLLFTACQGDAGSGTPGAGGMTGTGATGTGGMMGSGATSSGGSSAGSTSSGGAGGAGGSAGGAGGSGGTPVAGACPLNCSNPAMGACSAPQVRITEVDVGSTVLNNESETELEPLAIAAIPSGGSRLSWMGEDGSVHVAQLDCNDQLVGTPFSFPAHDYQDIAADDAGGVILLTRDATGGGTLNCGEPTNLCGTPPNPPIPCFDMWMVRFDCAGNENWSALLTTATAQLPPYSTSQTGETAFMIWWYQHQGRLAFDGTNYAAYFCDAISTSEGGCINIHQGDRMQVVGPNGTVIDHEDAFDIGCSHSGYTRIVWDPSAERFAMICKTDNNNRIAMPSPYSTVIPVDLDSSNVGDIVLASGGGYWATVSNLGEVHLLRFAEGQEADEDIVLASADYPHLASYGASNILAAWESGSELTVQVRDAASGAEVSGQVPVAVPGNRYQSFESFPDGSVAYPAPGTSDTTIRIARILPCGG